MDPLLLPGRWLEQGRQCLILHYAVSHGGSSSVLIYSTIHSAASQAREV